MLLTVSSRWTRAHGASPALGAGTFPYKSAVISGEECAAASVGGRSSVCRSLVMNMGQGANGIANYRATDVVGDSEVVKEASLAAE